MLHGIVARVLIADDHAIVRDGLAAIIGLQPDMVVVAQAANGQEAIDAYRLHQPDITLMDVRMPIVDGMTATRVICHEFPSAQIVIVTSITDEEQIADAFQAGARRYVLKDAPRAELLHAIRELVSAAIPVG